MLTLAYNGTDFLGSQAQKESTNTILGNIERVFTKININSKIIASGRTDKGVHATGQVISFDIPIFWQNIKRLQKILNEMLPSTIQVKHIKIVNDKFHARYSAKKRVYRYIIKNEKSNPFENDFISFYENINFEDIQKNIKLFIGEFDFKNYIKTGSDIKSTKRTIYKAFAYKHKDYIVLNFEANGFLRSQIRLMVGGLLNLNKKEIQEQLLCEVKHKIKPAKCNGLYLAKIKY
jgi:tRNA pseudouridine38-40 synthase